MDTSTNIQTCIKMDQQGYSNTEFHLKFIQDTKYKTILSVVNINKITVCIRVIQYPHNHDTKHKATLF